MLISLSLRKLEPNEKLQFSKVGQPICCQVVRNWKFLRGGLDFLIKIRSLLVLLVANNQKWNNLIQFIQKMKKLNKIQRSQKHETAVKYFPNNEKIQKLKEDEMTICDE
ncbi:uncharacterized protein LOC110711445 isoform X1 [Chenopodium quinoa]|uniref:uncharacterized protein LOC110711445 isoform X1 n=1 Tax=Chenopodium quinoa TaxID=63459 RepID=UPI000B76DD26|nr:uncharacterized protein LOC110711445 isoform X1 [Chenopodium quinoa]